MISQIKLALMMCLSASIGLCWYPLSNLQSMQMETSQILFFAFATGALLTSPLMAHQVKLWRNKTLEMLVFGLVGGISIAVLHYSLMNGFPIVSLSLFAMSAVGSLFINRVMDSDPISAGEFLTLLSLLLASLLILLSIEQLSFHWTSGLAIIAGIGFYRLMMINQGSTSAIPLGSRVAAVFIAATWLVGMMLIFSPRANSFPLENAALFSALYGGMILLPIVISVVCLFLKHQLNAFLLWVALILVFNLGSILISSIVTTFGALLWGALLLILGAGIKLLIKKDSLSMFN